MKMLQRLNENRKRIKSYRVLRRDISKRRVSFTLQDHYLPQQDSLGSQIISRYAIKTVDVNFEYFQFLSYFFLPKRHEAIHEAVVYKEKYLRLKEVQKLSENVCQQQEQKYKKKLTLLEKEYIHLQAEQSFQAKELSSYEQKENSLRNELHKISLLRETELQEKVQKLYLDKIKIEKNPHGPQQIAALIHQCHDPLSKKELVNLYRAYENLQVLHGEGVSETQIQERTKKIFIKLKTYVLKTKQVDSQELIRYVTEGGKKQINASKVQTARGATEAQKSFIQDNNQSLFLQIPKSLRGKEAHQQRDSRQKLKNESLIHDNNQSLFLHVPKFLQGKETHQQRDIIQKMNYLLTTYKEASSNKQEKPLSTLKRFLYSVYREQSSSYKPFVVLRPNQHDLKKFEQKFVKLFKRGKDVSIEELYHVIEESLQVPQNFYDTDDLKAQSKEYFSVERYYKGMLESVKEQNPLQFISMRQKQIIFQKSLKKGRDNSVLVTKQFEKVAQEAESKKRTLTRTNIKTEKINVRSKEYFSVDKYYQGMLESVKEQSPFQFITMRQKQIIFQKSLKKGIDNTTLVAKHFEKVVQVQGREQETVTEGRTVEKTIPLEAQREKVYRYFIQRLQNDITAIGLSPVQKKVLYKNIDKLFTKNQGVDFSYVERVVHGVKNMLRTKRDKDIVKAFNEFFTVSSTESLLINSHTNISKPLLQEGAFGFDYFKELVHGRKDVSLNKRDKSSEKKALDVFLERMYHTQLTSKAHESVTRVEKEGEKIFLDASGYVHKALHLEEKTELAYKHLIQTLKRDRTSAPLLPVQKKALYHRINRLFLTKTSTASVHISEIIEMLDIPDRLTMDEKGLDSVEKIRKIYARVEMEILKEKPFAFIAAHTKSILHKEITKRLLKKSDVQTHEFKKILHVIKGAERLNRAEKEVSRETTVLQTSTQEKHKNEDYFTDLNKPRVEEMPEQQTAKRQEFQHISSESLNLAEEEAFSMLHIGVGRKAQARSTVKKEETERYIAQSVLEKKVELEKSVGGMVSNLDSQLDELAVKIFKEIKNEIYLEFERA